MAGKQVTELDALPSFTDTSLLPVHNGAGLKKGLLSQLASYLGTKFSNPNLLINPDFKINQRGSTSYESDTGTTIKNVYSVDRWSLYGHKLVVNSDKSITLTPTSYSNGTFSQILEGAVEGDVTIQVYVAGISGSATVLVTQSDGTTTSTIGNLKNGLNVFHFNKGIKKLYIRALSGTLTLKYAKVEKGTVATSFITPNMAEELAKCQYYTVIFEPWRTILNANTDSSVINIDTRCKMRTKPTISYITLKSGTANQFNFVSILSSKAYLALKTNNWTSFIDSKNEVVVVNTGSGISSGAFGQVTFDNSLMLDAEIY